MITITSATEYKDFLKGPFLHQARHVGNSTHEVLNVSLILKGDEPLGYCDPHYLRAVWEVIESYAPTGIAPAVTDLLLLDWFAKNHMGWFDRKAAMDYGVEIFAQMPGIESELRGDYLSRRAVIKMTGTKCLESIQYLIRDELHPSGNSMWRFTLVGTFRSMDAIWGLPADVHWLRRLAAQHCDGLTLDECAIDIVLHCKSLHVYDKDLRLVDDT